MKNSVKREPPAALPGRLACGLEGVALRNQAGFSLQLSLTGAQVLGWQNPQGEELLYCSPCADFSGKKPIRGGIPICWPQFGPAAVPGEEKLPQHGFARIAHWQNAGHKITGESVETTLRLDSEPAHAPALQSGWPHSFELVLRIVLRRNELLQTLSILNCSPGPEPFSSTLAFHQYIRVPASNAVKISGLSGTTISDSLRSGLEFIESRDPLEPDLPIDQIVKNAPADVIIEAMGKPLMQVSSSNLPQVVIWNPGPQDAEKRSPDLASDSWRHFICVERARLTPITLAPGETAEFSQRLVALQTRTAAGGESGG